MIFLIVGLSLIFVIGGAGIAFYRMKEFLKDDPFYGL